MSILKVENLAISFGGLKAIDDLSFTVEENSIFALIGPNGAGKTTIFNCLSRFYTPDQGRITFRGNIDLLKLKVHQVIGVGLSRTFQNVELFKNMTVLDNLIVGQHQQTKGGFFAQSLAFPIKKEEMRIREKALEIMD